MPIKVFIRAMKRRLSLASLRVAISHPRTTVQLSLLGVLAGICSGTLIILFRLSYESLQLLWLDEVDNFSSLAPEMRLLIPIVGALAIFIFATITGFKHYRTGIPFVIYRVKNHNGLMPLKNTLNQFFGGMAALASGFSVGREGPSVHLGAAGSSFIGNWLKLPYNSIRILTGCGIAAGISASFNTPFAAVLFVMEVVLREYKIHIFIPIMLAAACGSVLSRMVFGDDHELAFLTIAEFEPWMYLYFILFGAVLGGVSTLFNIQIMNVIRWFRPMSMFSRLLLAGVITGLVGWFVPYAMGSGFSAIHWVVTAPQDIQLLLSILMAKFVLTIFAIGLGIPGGLIGPVLGLGALLGAILMYPLHFAYDDPTHLTSSFAILGIAAFLTSVVHAPLAALSAVMELSNSVDVVLPAMMVIVPSYVTANQFFKNSSIFIRQLDYQNLPYSTSSIRSTLQKVGVLALVDRQYKLFIDATDKHILDFLDTAPTHPVVQKTTYEIDSQYFLVQYDYSLNREESPLRFFPMQGVSSQSTLAEVYEILQHRREGAVYVQGDTPYSIVGVITWDAVRGYLYRKEY